MSDLIWILAAYVSGTIPYAYWIGRAVIGRDIRAVGDGNPGGTNFFKSGGPKYYGWGVLVLLLEVLKVMVPVMFGAWYGNLQGWWLVALAVAPVLGNAFSPFLKFHGSKSIAAITGMWGGLTFFIIPLILATLFTVLTRVLKNDAWGVIASYLVLLAGFVVLRSEWFYFAIWLGTFLILVYRWRKGLLPGS